MYLPRNIDVLQASELSWLSSPPLGIEVRCCRVHWMPVSGSEFMLTTLFLFEDGGKFSAWALEGNYSLFWGSISIAFE